jgi:hypothetical protein
MKRKVPPKADTTKRMWECRYSSSEMLYLEMMPAEVRCYLYGQERTADHWSFERSSLGNRMRRSVTSFGAKAVDEVKAAVRERMEQMKR